MAVILTVLAILGLVEKTGSNWSDLEKVMEHISKISETIRVQHVRHLFNFHSLKCKLLR